MNLLQMIVDRLYEYYPNLNIYVKDMEQGVIEPCFFVKVIDSSMSIEFDKRYRASSLVNIVYLDNSASAEKLNTMAMNLLAILSNIGVYAQSMSSHIDDDSFSIAITYIYMLKELKVPDVLMMKNRTIQGKRSD